jgi:hypothetical protein
MRFAISVFERAQRNIINARREAGDLYLLLKFTSRWRLIKRMVLQHRLRKAEAEVEEANRRFDSLFD